jgi:hypothetical protein
MAVMKEVKYGSLWKTCVMPVSATEKSTTPNVGKVVALANYIKG